MVDMAEIRSGAEEFARSVRAFRRTLAEKIADGTIARQIDKTVQGVGAMFAVMIRRSIDEIMSAPRER